jgi:flagellar biosynthesis protein FlhB
MADGPDKDQQTETPSGRKLARARSQGQVAQSREVNTWFMMAAGTGIVMFLAAPIARVLEHALFAFMKLSDFLGPDGVQWTPVQAALGRVLIALALPMMVLVAAAFAGTVLQIGLVFATEKSHFDISRLSPLAGLKRLFSMRSTVELMKNLVKVCAVAGMALWMAWPAVDQITRMAGEPAELLPGEIYKTVMRLLLGVMAIVTILAVTDYADQRYAFTKSMRMTKQEVKEEHKQTEGDPKIKSKLRQIRMQRSRRRMMKAVPTASVIITNPTHFAVALLYEMGAASAPKVVAKGADLIALRIREIGEENDVPIVENPPLARSLYASVEIDHEIQPEHYKAVAEIISYVFRLKGKMKAPPRRPL